MARRKKKDIYLICGMCKEYRRLKYEGARKYCDIGERGIIYYERACDKFEIGDYIWCGEYEFETTIDICINRLKNNSKCKKCVVGKILNVGKILKI
jgi:hypothetical protein